MQETFMPCFNSYEVCASAYVAESVKRILSRGGRGELLMVNSAGVYLCAEGEIIFLCDVSWGCVPIGVAVDGFSDIVVGMKLEQGQSFTFCENVIRFQNGSLRIEAKPTIKIEACRAKPQALLLHKAATQLVAMRKERGISMLAEPLLLSNEATETVSLNPYAARAYPQIISLQHALLNDSQEEIRSSVEALLGLGTGLTPSADDVLLGMLYTFRLLSGDAPTSVSAFCESVLNACDERTNRVSAAYLKAIINGEYFERIELVFDALCGKRTLDITEITAVGSNSGSEMLLGMLCAAKVCGYMMAPMCNT